MALKQDQLVSFFIEALEVFFLFFEEQTKNLCLFYVRGLIQVQCGNVNFPLDYKHHYMRTARV